MKINVFLSVAGREGVEAGKLLKTELEAFVGTNGIKFQCHLYTDSPAIGESITGSYTNQIEKSNFFVPVLTPEYAKEIAHLDAQEELTMALQRDKEILKMSNGRFRFIFPYAPTDGERIIKKILRLSGRIYATNVIDLANAMIKNSPFALLEDQTFGFDKDWPHSFFDTNGEPNVLMVLGHSGKENPPDEEDIKSLKICSIEEELIKRYDESLLDSSSPQFPTQSMRIAEYLPKLIQFLSNKYLELNPKKQSVPEIKTDIDWHLISYRQKLLETNHLMCFGAGDTNWISRAVLAYYGSLLPVSFDFPNGSQVLHYKTSIKSQDNPKNDTSGQLEFIPEIRHIQQTKGGKGHFGAILLLLPNPWNITKRVIIAAGLTALGSQASILALCDPRISQLGTGGIPWARVIRGVEGKEDEQYKAVDFEFVG